MPDQINEQFTEEQKLWLQRKADLTEVTIKWLELVTELLEIIVSIIILAGFFLALIPIIGDMPGLLSNQNTYSFDVFLEYSFNLVIGIEFVRMLVKHTPGAALQVLLFAIARHLVLDGGSGMDLLLGVIAIAGIFAVRKFLYVHSFESRDDGSAFTYFRAQNLIRHKTEREIEAETRRARLEEEMQNTVASAVRQALQDAEKSSNDEVAMGEVLQQAKELSFPDVAKSQQEAQE